MGTNGVSFDAKIAAYEKYLRANAKELNLSEKQVDEQILRYFDGLKHDANKAFQKRFGKDLAREIVESKKPSNFELKVAAYEKYLRTNAKKLNLSEKQVDEQILRYMDGLKHDENKAIRKQSGKDYARELARENASKAPVTAPKAGAAAEALPVAPKVTAEAVVAEAVPIAPKLALDAQMGAKIEAYEKYLRANAKDLNLSEKQIQEQVSRYFDGLVYDAKKVAGKQAGKETSRKIAEMLKAEAVVAEAPEITESVKDVKPSFFTKLSGKLAKFLPKTRAGKIGAVAGLAGLVIGGIALLAGSHKAEKAEAEQAVLPEEQGAATKHDAQPDTTETRTTQNDTAQVVIPPADSTAVDSTGVVIPPADSTAVDSTKVVIQQPDSTAIDSTGVVTQPADSTAVDQNKVTNQQPDNTEADAAGAATQEGEAQKSEAQKTEAQKAEDEKANDKKEPAQEKENPKAEKAGTSKEEKAGAAKAEENPEAVKGQVGLSKNDGMTVAELKGEIKENVVENRYLRREIRLNNRYERRIGAPNETKPTNEEMRAQINENKAENREYRQQIRDIRRVEREERRLERKAHRDIARLERKARQDEQRLLAAADTARKSGLELNEAKLEEDVKNIQLTAQTQVDDIYTKTEQRIGEGRLSIRA